MTEYPNILAKQLLAKTRGRTRPKRFNIEYVLCIREIQAEIFNFSKKVPKSFHQNRHFFVDTHFYFRIVFYIFISHVT